MSGLLLLLMLGGWVGLTALLVYRWRHEAQRTRGAKWRVHAFFIPLLLCWLAASFWYAGGRKIYYDAEVDRLCEIDGGVKVYERVTLPAAEYDRLVAQNWILPDASEVKESDSYFKTRETRYFRESDPQVAKTVIRYIRRSDGKVVGEYIHYGRGGGDLPGPWHGSNHSCPNPAKTPGITRQLFSRGQ